MIRCLGTSYLLDLGHYQELGTSVTLLGAFSTKYLGSSYLIYPPCTLKHSSSR